MKKRYFLFARILIGLILLLFLFYKIGIKDLSKTLVKFNFSYIPLIISLLILSFILGAINFKIMTSPIKKINFINIFKYYCLSWVFSLITPGKLGQFSIILFLKKEKISTAQGIVVSLLDRIITFIVFFIVSIFGFFIFFTYEQALKLIAIGLLILAITIIFIFSNFSRNIIKKYFLRKYADKFKGFSKFLFIYLKQYKNILLLDFLMTFLKLLVSSLFIFTIFLAFSSNVPFIYTIIIDSAVTIISLIPISISGLGLREYSAVFLFEKVNISNSVVLSVFLISLLIHYISAFFIYLFFIIKKQAIF